MGTRNDPDTDDLQTTTEHSLVRKLIEERDDYLAHLAGSDETGDQGLFQIGLADADDEDLKGISWEQFFEEKDLAFACRESGEEDRTDFTYLRRRDDSA